MSQQNLNKKENKQERELVFTRTFDAPRDLVWKAWTDPQQIVKWWGPNGFTTETQSMDVKTGGAWKFVMRGPDGRDYPNFITYDEIVKPERLVYSHTGDGNSPEPVRFQTTVTFEAEGHQTRVTMQLLFPSAEQRDWVVKEYKADEGGRQTLARLAEHLGQTHASKSPEFTISRTFDAPRDLVWKAWTTPELMAKWWGPKGAKVGRYTMDFRVGGIYHYSMATADGTLMWGKFIYRDIKAPEKLVFLNSFSDEKGNIGRHPFLPTWPREMLSTITFSEQKGKTTVTVHWTPFNATPEEVRTFADGAASMNQGWSGTFDQLGDFLKE